MRRHSDLHQSAAISAVLLVLLFALPLAVVVPFQTELFSDDPIAVESEREPFQPGDLDGEMVLKVLAGDTVEEMTLGEYLVGVVRAEMPASFEPEALKAQTVAARTYTLSKMERTVEAHPDADVCTDITCCQAYIDPADAAANWGENAQTYTDKIAAAVADTDGMAALFQGQPIQAVFFSSAPGQTVDAVEVWGSDVAYLKSVSSPEGEEVPNYHSQAVFSADQVRQAVLAAYPAADLSGDPSGWFGTPTTNEGGTVSSIPVGGVTLTGGQVRTLFSLRSACFTVAWDGSNFTFSVTGYGHGVGMSQYGANAMARAGSTFRDILTWYYTGAQVDQLWS